MKSINVKNLLPHVVAIGIFLLVTIVFCKSSLESGIVLKQSDMSSAYGMSHQLSEYKKVNGHLPLWCTNMFSGMPAYQILMEGDYPPLFVIDKILQFGLPQPLNFFFLSCISFYFLCICLGVRPYAAVIGSLGFAFCSYNPIIISVGHITKMMALAYAPAVIGAIVLIFNKRYLSGFVLTTLLSALQLQQNHPQISYYLFLILGFMSIAYVIRFVVKKEFIHLTKTFSLLIVAGLLAIGANALILMTTLDYTKESKRGGQLVLNKNEKQKDIITGNKTTGLSKDYAFMWSYGKAETWSLMFPAVLGYGSHQAQRDGDYTIFPKIKDNGPLITYMNENTPQLPAEQIASQLNGALYWGKQPFTEGPVYLGVVICFLFLMGLFVLDNKHKWWITAVCIFAVLLAWGDNFPEFNYFIFDNFPLYNKFRVPTMILVIPQLLFPLMAALVLDKLIHEDNISWKPIKQSALATGLVFAMIGLFYFSSDFSNENKERTNAFNNIVKTGGTDAQAKISELDNKYKPQIDNRIYEGMLGSFSNDPTTTDPLKASRDFLSALRKERASFLMDDIIKALFLVVLSLLLIYLYTRKKINALLLVAGIGLISTADLFSFGKNYLDKNSYEIKDDFEANEFPLSDADRRILGDPDPNFRVFNTSGMDESHTSYYHKSIGGYHPAKLGIYDDLIAYQFKGNMNFNVINMLNTKYFIVQQGDQKMAQQNPQAMGNVWFVKAIQYVKDPSEEMLALTNFNPKDTAIVESSFKSKIGSFDIPDSTDYIKQTQFDNDVITYESNTKGSRVAVFSEVYYKDWYAYIDNKPVDFFKTNYVLRGMYIPAGKHKIDFKFEPPVYYTGRKISTAASWFIILLLLALLSKSFMQSKNKTEVDA
jgi:hypothetical protein